MGGNSSSVVLMAQGAQFVDLLLQRIDALQEIGLWMEDPQWTPTWVHLQIVPPGSRRRVYIPSSRPPLAARLPEQLTGGLT